MQPQIILKDGNIILLSDETYQTVLELLERQASKITPASSIEELETEFAELFTQDDASIKDLLEEHRLELEREERKLEMFD